MKTRIPTILCLLLLAPMLFADNPTPLPTLSVNEYGIDPEALYPGAMVTDLLRASEDEAASSVKDAFDEGYKQGRVDGAALWKPRYDMVSERAAKAEKRPTLKDVFIAALSGLAIGAGGSALYHLTVR